MIWVFSNSDDISVPDGIVWLLNANEKCRNKSLVSKNKKTPYICNLQDAGIEITCTVL